MATSASRDPNRAVSLLGTSNVNDRAAVPIWADPSTHELLVKASVSITPSGTQNVNLTQVGSSAIALGQQVAALSLPVVQPPDVTSSTIDITARDVGSTSTLGANNQSIVTGTPTANSTATFTVTSQETVRVQVSGTWTGTLTSEVSLDGGTTWSTQGVHQTGTSFTTAAFTGNFSGGTNASGITNYRLRATAAWTGTATVRAVESLNSGSVYVANAAPSGSIISFNNGSTATLLANAVYTGTGEDVTNYSEMRVSVIANVASANDGISIQQSTDNTNWDITDVYTIPANTGKTFVVPRQARYFRVVYTNGGTNQASFRLQVVLNRTGTAPSSQRPNDAYTNETDLVQQQSFLMGYNGATWDRLRTTGTGVLSTSAVLTAGSAVIGHVIADTGSTTAVTQATGTNLHTVVDSGTITAVTAITNALPTGTNTLGGVNLVPATTGGLLTMNATSSDGATALTSTAQVIKATAGQLFGYYIYNPNATAQFVQFYNTAAASVTVGTTNPLFMLTIPPTSAANLMGETGITFSNAGWSWAATTTAGGNGAPSTALDAVAWYK